jgi:hypothetical protein
MKNSYGDQINEDEIGRAYSACEKDEKHTEFYDLKPEKTEE